MKVWSATYNPFGGVHVSTGTLPANRFPGQWFQSESGLHQNWMRDYDPTTGRYLQADPLGLVDGASVYGYVKQSPMRNIDPRGEELSDLLNSPFGRKALGTAAGATLGDGPFPFGDVIGACVVGVAALYCAADGYYCTTTNDCDAAFETENSLCRMLYDQSSRRQCFTQAQENYSRCLRNAD